MGTGILCYPLKTDDYRPAGTGWTLATRRQFLPQVVSPIVISTPLQFTPSVTQQSSQGPQQLRVLPLPRTEAPQQKLVELAGPAPRARERKPRLEAAQAGPSRTPAPPPGHARPRPPPHGPEAGRALPERGAGRRPQAGPPPPPPPLPPRPPPAVPAVGPAMGLCLPCLGGAVKDVVETPDPVSTARPLPPPARPGRLRAR